MSPSNSIKLYNKHLRIINNLNKQEILSLIQLMIIFAKMILKAKKLKSF